MKLTTTILLAVLAAAVLWSSPSTSQATQPAAEALRAEFRQLGPQLLRSPYGAPLHLESAERDGLVLGHIHAVLDQPFTTARGMLAEATAWCDLLLLSSNVKGCESLGAGAAVRVKLRVASTARQVADDAPVLSFEWRRAALEPDFLKIEMRAAQGPAGTRDYRLDAQLVEIDRTRSFLRLSYAFGYNDSGGLAIRLYLATIARDKVGFTVEEGQPVRGLRGVVERNTMRYFIALRSYLEGRAASQPLETVLDAWFAAADRYPSQLRELTREEYLAMKRAEFAAHHKPAAAP